MKKLLTKIISLIITILISFLTIFVLTGIFDKRTEVFPEKKNQDESNSSEIIDKTDDNKNTNNVDTVINNRDKSTIISNDSQNQENEILENVDIALSYLNGTTKNQDVLSFHKTRLSNYYRIKGLKSETNTLLLSTIAKINTELKKETKPITRKKSDNSKKEKVQNDSLAIAE